MKLLRIRSCPSACEFELGFLSLINSRIVLYRRKTLGALKNLQNQSRDNKFHEQNEKHINKVIILYGAPIDTMQRKTFVLSFFLILKIIRRWKIFSQTE